jgi:purine-cytosine permease-like protein
MKKIMSLVAIIATPALAFAQNPGDEMEREMFKTSSIIFLFALIMLFVFLILKHFLDYRIKHKILDKEIPENVVASILQITPKENGNANIRWFSILMGLGVGLTIVYYTMPLGIHSMAIMMFCIAASFLGYFLFLKYSNKEK